MNTKIGAFVWCVVLALFMSYVVSLYHQQNLNFNSNILSLLPADEADPAIDIAFERFSEQNLRELFFLVKSPDLDQAKGYSTQFSNALTNSPWVESVTLKVSNEEQFSIASFNYDYRHHLLSTSDEGLLSANDYDEFSEFVVSLAFSPVSANIVNLISVDPFLLSYRFGLNESIDNFPGLVLDDGYLVANIEDQFYILLTARLNASPFNQTLQAQMKGLETQWEEQVGEGHLLRTGALFYTRYAYETAQREVSVIGGGSLLLIICLIIFAFRSLKPILFVALTILFGLLSGYCVVRFLFGEVHLLTVVFGGSLIGVAVDYIFHFLVAKENGSSYSRVVKILPAITLGLLSSILGYAALALTPFPGLQQMSVFCIAGLIAAYSTVVFVFPGFSCSGKRSPAFMSINEKIIKFGRSKFSRNIWTVALLLPLVAISIIIWGEEYKEDVRQFQAMDETLLAQETQIKSVLNTPAANQFYLVKGATKQELLTNLENAAPNFDMMIASGQIDGIVNISQWLPSIATQQNSYALYQALYQSNTHAELIEFGLLSEQQFALVQAEFSAHEGQYLQPEQWLNSPLGQRLSYLWLDQVGQEYFAVVAIRGLKAGTVLTDINADVLFVDKISTINNLLQSYRANALVFFLFSVVLIFGLLSSRFGVKRAGLVLSAPLLAISFTIIILQVMVGSINLFNVLAFFLILGVGVDFGIFFATTNKIVVNTMLGISLSALTTVFSFGILSLSQTTVIASYGMTMLIGITSVFFLSPMVGALLEHNNETYS